jgi:hypothetical protein
MCGEDLGDGAAEIGGVQASRVSGSLAMGRLSLLSAQNVLWCMTTWCWRCAGSIPGTWIVGEGGCGQAPNSGPPCDALSADAWLLPGRKHLDP